MSNYILTISSIICSSLHYIYIININIKPIYTIGCITSIINHLFTNKYIKWIDRIVMLIGIKYEYDNSKFLIDFMLLYTSIILFIYSKYTCIVYYHVLSHFVITFKHIIY